MTANETPTRHLVYRIRNEIYDAIPLDKRHGFDITTYQYPSKVVISFPALNEASLDAVTYSPGVPLVHQIYSALLAAVRRDELALIETDTYSSMVSVSAFLRDPSHAPRLSATNRPRARALELRFLPRPFSVRFPDVLPYLTRFYFNSMATQVAGDLEDILLNFMENCRSLKVASLHYTGQNLSSGSWRELRRPSPRQGSKSLVTLPSLKSFTQKFQSTPGGAVPIGLFNQLVLPRIRSVRLTDKGFPSAESWDDIFPISEHHFSRYSNVKISVYTKIGSVPVRATLSNSNHKISLKKATGLREDSHKVVEEILEFLIRRRIDSYLETLHLEHCLDGTKASKGILDRVKCIASRRNRSHSLRKVTLTVEDDYELESWYEELRRLGVDVEVILKEQKVLGIFDIRSSSL